MKNTTGPRLSAIAAMSENRVIGRQNQLPWRLPADLRHFKTLTLGSPVVMGRKTYESIGRPLPGRTNIIMTRHPSFQAPGCLVVTSIAEAVESARESESHEIFIIGGAEIYRQLMPAIERLYLTIVHAVIEGDAFFPELNAHEWKETGRVRHEADEDNGYDYSFVTLDRV